MKNDITKNGTRLNLDTSKFYYINTNPVNLTKDRYGFSTQKKLEIFERTARENLLKANSLLTQLTSLTGQIFAVPDLKYDIYKYTYKNMRLK